MASGISIADLIHDLGVELEEGLAKAEKRKVRFALEQVDIEVQVTTMREAGLEGKVKFWVYEAGGGGKMSAGEMHTIKLRLTPCTTDAAQKPPPTGKVLLND